MSRFTFFALATLLVAQILPAQPRQTAPAEVVRAERLKQLRDSLTPGSKSLALGQGSNFTYTIWHRDTTGGLERHEAWTDVLVIQSGSGTILSGGVQEGASESSPGEWRGGTARGVTRQVIRAGDIVTTPAGTPHQMILAPGEQITYVVFKVAAQPSSSRSP